MKILEYFEKAWIAAAVVAVVVGVVNLIRLRVFDNRVYFPLLCAMFCILIWFNIRGQRRFRKKMLDENSKKEITDK